MKKKLLYLALSLGICAAVVGCSGKKKESTEWIETEAKKISEDITSGQFVVDGVVYEFPMDLQQWLDNGWHISNNYDNVDTFTLEPNVYSNEFELFNEDDDFVRVSVINTSNKDAKIEDCMVYSLYMSTTEVDVVLPDGLTKRNKPDDVIDAYGEPLSKGDESGELEALYYYEKGDWKCYVEVDVIDNDYTINPLTSISFDILSAEAMWDNLVDTEGSDKAVEFYINAAMKASFSDDFADYVDYGFDTTEGAEELYQSEIEYYAYSLMSYCDVNDEYVSDEVIDRFCKIAKELIAKAKWNVKSVEMNAFGEGTAVLEIYPIDFIYIVEEDIMQAIDNFNTKYADVDTSAISDEEYQAMEEDYATEILDAIEKKVSGAGTLDAVEFEYEVDLNDTFLSEDAWNEIDDAIMGFVE